MRIFSRYDTPKVSGIYFKEPSMTQQHLANECDINMIIERAIRTGDTTVFTTAQRAEYYDASSFSDYQASLEYLDGVRADFDSLPSSTRKEFRNDVSHYVSFMSDPANYAKAVELGLLQGGEAATVEPSSSGSAHPSGDSSQAAAS